MAAPPIADAAFLRSISPLTKAGRITTPLFVYAGANDPRVPRAQSDCIVSTLRRFKIPVEYMVAADEGHGYRKRTTQTELATRVVAFLERALGVSERVTLRTRSRRRP
jgi:dipeptidyl aminopeptidase/acylaminoacyl peptidase